MARKHKSPMTTGVTIGVGVALGTALGAATGNIALGVALGVVFAAALGRGDKSNAPANNTPIGDPPSGRQGSS